MEPRGSSAVQDQPVISVVGSSVLRRSPELATVHVSVEFDGDERSAVIARTIAGQAQVTAWLGDHEQPAIGVTSWSAPQLRVWEARPWNQQGEQLPVVHHANATISAVFEDRDRLAAWLAEITEADGVAVQQLVWSLTEEHRIAAETEGLAAAVADARRRATAIATALGLLTVRPLAVSDPGLLPTGEASMLTSADASAPRLMRAAATSGPGEGVVLEPDDLEIGVLVHARFAAE